ncbi:MAG: FG-GAP-like repeat-containing protein [Bdellovibrionota bacterium]
MASFGIIKAYAGMATLVFLSSCGNSSGANAAQAIAGTSESSFLLQSSDGVYSLPPSSHQADQYFGASVTLGDFNGDGEMDMAVGAPLADIPLTLITAADTGAVYVYYSVSSKSSDISEADLVLRQGTDFNSQFGTALHASDIDGDGFDDLLIGAPYDDRVGVNTGSLYYYKGKADGFSSVPSEIFDNPTYTLNSSFGSAIIRADLDGDTYPELIVGAEANDTGGTDRGGFWIFAGTSQGQYNFASGLFIRDSSFGATSDFCGRSLGVIDYNGDTIPDIVMGCPRDDTAGTDRGSFRIFLGNSTPGSWVTSATIASAEIPNPASTANTDYFGDSLIVADINNDGTDDLIVGSYLANSGITDNGLVYIFNSFNSSNTSVDLIVSPPWTHTSAQRFGSAFAFGDVNGDGFNDLSIGATGGELQGYRSGQVGQFFADSNGVVSFVSQDRFVTYDFHAGPVAGRYSANSDFGSALCKMDYNRDGIEDLIVGSTTDDRKYTDDGSVSIYFSSSDGSISGKPDFVLVSPTPLISARQFGSACLGMDVNGDGITDLLVGASQNDDFGLQSGSVYIYLGNSTSTDIFPSYQINGPSLLAYLFGSSLAAGDLNNDGFDDLIVGASGADVGGTDRGAVYVYQSDNVTGAINFSSYSTFQHSAAANSDFLGASVLAYDYDGDGDDDLLAGAPGDNDDGTDAGKVYIWINAGTADTLLDSTHDQFLLHPESNLNSGFGSAMAKGLYSNDTYPDLFVGASLDDIYGANSGAVFAYTGIASGILSNPNIFYPPDLPARAVGETFGASILTLDLDKDGVNDLIVGAPQDDNFGINAGSVYIDANL